MTPCNRFSGNESAHAWQRAARARDSPAPYVQVVGLLGERSAEPLAFFPTQICHGHSSSTICNVTTLRKGLTKREAAGYAAWALVVWPVNWEDVELALGSSKRGPAPVAAVSRGHPMAVRCAGSWATVSEAAGVCQVLSCDAVVLETGSSILNGQL